MVKRKCLCFTLHVPYIAILLHLPVTVFVRYTSYWFIVAFHHICHFTASSSVRLFCFTILFTSLSHFVSDLPLLFIASGDQVSIPLVRLLSPILNMMSILGELRSSGLLRGEQR